jgi:hypothetical protein
MYNLLNLQRHHGSPAMRASLSLIALLLISTMTARAEPFDIELVVQAGTQSKTAHAEIAALGLKPKPREVLTAKAGTPIQVRWTLTNGATKKTYKNVVVHFVVVKQEKLNQLQVPKLNRGVAAESALTMDFEPKDSTRGAVTFTIETAGLYLIRLETIGAAEGAEGHENFAALDLAVE